MKLDELSCPSCMAKIEGALNTTNGVEMVGQASNIRKMAFKVKKVCHFLPIFKFWKYFLSYEY